MQTPSCPANPCMSTGDYLGLKASPHPRSGLTTEESLGMGPSSQSPMSICSYSGALGLDLVQDHIVNKILEYFQCCMQGWDASETSEGSEG